MLNVCLKYIYISERYQKCVECVFKIYIYIFQNDTKNVLNVCLKYIYISERYQKCVECVFKIYIYIFQNDTKNVLNVCLKYIYISERYQKCVECVFKIYIYFRTIPSSVWLSRSHVASYKGANSSIIQSLQPSQRFQNILWWSFTHSGILWPDWQSFWGR